MADRDNKTDDAPKDEEEKEKVIVVPREHTRIFFAYPSNFTKIVSNMKLIFASWALLGYCIQFLLIITVINIYSDIDRHIPCAGATSTQEASSYYDKAFVLLASYHLIEYFRFTIFMVACFLGVNMITLYYILYLNTLFGIAAYIAAHVVRFNATGKECADK